MKVSRWIIRTALLLVSCCAPATFVLAQRPPQQSEDVVKVNTELVQTDFMVFDKQGSFVDGLKRDQFTLKVEGKSRDITFFDRVAAGSRNEEAQLAAARGAPGKGTAVPLDRGRIVMFFLDDLHLSVGGMKQARDLLSRFVERDMAQNDLAEIASTSGQLGFLQQLTDNKSVLTTAIERLRSQQLSTAKTAERPPMTEYQAQLIDQHDTDILDYFVDAILAENPNIPRDTAVEMVRQRASGMLQEASSITTRALSTFKKWIDQAGAVPGRKVVFFISEGFLLDSRNSDNYDRLQRITSAAARSGIVIYSIDARGLAPGQPDASTAVAADPGSRLSRATMGEGRAMQDALNALAAETGGRAFFNSNDLSAAVTAGLKETSAYYLIAWRPDNDEQRNPKYRRIEIGIENRPDLVVRFRRGFGELPEQTAKPKEQPSPSPQKADGEQVASILRAPYAQSNLPVAISLNYLDIAQYGGTLTTAIRVSTSSLPIVIQDGAPTALLDVAGGVFNDQGKSISTFNKRFTIKGKTDSANAKPPDQIFYNHFSLVKPGIYQVRIAAIDVKQGASGSAYQWIEIPDLHSKGLTLSSLLVGEKKTGTDVEFTDNNPNVPPGPPAIQQVALNVDHRFARTSYLRFMTFIYNAVGGGDAAVPAIKKENSSTAPVITTMSSTPPDLAVQVQIFRDNEPVITTPIHAIQTEGLPDMQRIPYAADVPLDTLVPGAYVLRVTAIDRRAKTSASQSFNFSVE